MRKIILAVFIFFTAEIVAAQNDSTKLLVAFPITSYLLDLNDSTKLVQIVPGGLWEIKDKQLGLVKGLYRDGKADTATRGWGKCQLIKGDYYYFAIHKENSGSEFQAGDLLYTFMQMPLKYVGRLTKIATHYVSLQKVTEEYFFNRGDVFLDWDQQKETALLDSMVADIHFTGKYFKENNPGMNQKISGGRYNDKMVLETMMIIERKDISDFLDYIIARPRLYAGNNWKISEIFATWMVSGAPTVILN
ncbi:MAG: hypothetical protein ABUT20_11755 [Bacteroidota bacterium]